jgi:hypothetical protein
MDIHAPTQPVHNWRDFMTHLVIVTIGLFIALMMEAGVEWLHHRHIVREARANIRVELESNHQSAQQDIQLLQANIDHLQANITTLHTMRDNQKNKDGSLINTMSFNSFDEAAWNTARDTGALAYMPYEEVQGYSDLYMLSNIINAKAVSTGEREYTAMAPMMMGDDKLSPDTYTAMMHDDATSIIQLVALQQYTRQYDQICVAELKK